MTVPPPDDAEFGAGPEAGEYAVGTIGADAPPPPA
jgi:hypothetical protein